MSFLSDTCRQWKIVRSADYSPEQRIFTACELICKPISFLALFMIPGWSLLQRLGVPIPAWISQVLQPIAVSAAIGYLTNWLAIEMLFKPYKRTWRHPFAWITLGYWRQGLVPKNKAQIAKTMGEKVSLQLLQPEKLASDLSNMLAGFLDNKEVVARVQAIAKQQVMAHKQQIVDYLTPQIEQGILKEIDKLLTTEKIQVFWDKQIEPRLASQEFRNRLTQLIVNTIEQKTPDIANKIRPALKKVITDYCQEQLQGFVGGILSPILSPLADHLAERILSRQTIEHGIADWLNHPDTPATLNEGLSSMVESLRAYIKHPDSNQELSLFINDIRCQFKQYVNAWLQENLSAMTDAILRNEQLWSWGTELLTSCKPQIEAFVQTTGVPLILEKLNIQERIQTAVNNQDMEQFHEMINDVVAQHLGAIQVLGFILGGVAGAFMTFL